MRSELTRRLISAAFLGIIVLGATWYGGFGFRALMALCSVVVFYEWSTIVAGAPASAGSITALGWIVVIASALALAADRPQLAVYVGLFGGAVACIWGMVALRNAWAGAGVLYAALPAFALAEVRGTSTAGFVAVLFIFGVVWATDITAYFTGRHFGGPKLAVRISPSKTWSGAIGGTLGGIVVGALVAFLAHAGAHLWIVLLALCLSVVSQVGDLFESWVKRRFAVKDSSHLIPGHGGLMDRIDGLVFAAFAAYLLAALMSVSAGGERNVRTIGGGFWAPVSSGPASIAARPLTRFGGVGPWT